MHGRLTDQRHGGVAYYRMTEVLSQKVYLLKKTCKKTNVLFFAYVFSQTSCTDAKMLLKDVLKFCIINYSILLVYTARQTNPVDQQCKEHLVLQFSFPEAFRDMHDDEGNLTEKKNKKCYNNQISGLASAGRAHG